MSYQSNGRAVEESYDDSGTATNSRLLPGEGVNVGASNSARGEGTTTAELIAKFRFLNCCTSVYILLFHTMPLVLNPIRLTLLLSSPVKLILEIVVGVLALFLLLVEARIPILGERVLVLMRGFSVGRIQCIDLNVARGRVIALFVMGASIGMARYLAMGASRGGEQPSPVEIDAPSTNATDPGSEHTSQSSNDALSLALPIILQCLVFSPSVWILFGLAAYTLNVMNTFPDFGDVRAYSMDEYMATSGAASTSASSGPSWASNVGDYVRGNAGYQNLHV